ncbi:MAG: hypothetical protein JW822_04410 [Spirochaetales bacterium]|nr:hypothetical protein [Spirochaetales bacterium]
MKKIFLVVILCFLKLCVWCELKVDRDELTKGKGEEIGFVNYNGPYLYYYTLEEIRNIGVFLGNNIAKVYSRSTFNALYSIIHAVDLNDSSEKFDADIFVIEPNAFLDHVRNLRVILAGFLQSAYGYSYDDALLIAKFITYYNATFRGDVSYFKEHYKAVVMRHVSAYDAGLATTYSEWPGRTKVLIPLSDDFEKGDLSSLDTEELTREEVIEDLKKLDDKGVEDRKDIVELQERELEKEEKKLEEDKAILEEDKRQLEEDKRKLEEDKKSGEYTDEEIAEREEDIKKREAEIKERETEIAKREEEIKEKQEKIKKTREDIAEDDRSLPSDSKSTDRETSITETTDSGSGQGLFLKVQEGAEDSTGEIVLLDFKSDTLLARTENIKIKERRFYVFSGALLVTAEPDAENKSYLMLLDPGSLEVRIKSDEEVFARSLVLMNSNNIFAVIKKGNAYYIGKFDRNLKLLTATEQEVNPLTPLFLSGNSLYAQSKRGKVLQLAVSNLTLQKTATLP